MIPLVQFKLIVNGNDGARAILANEPLFPQEVAITGIVSYMRIPAEIGESLADMITVRGGVGTTRDDLNIPISFLNCGENVIGSLPDMVIAVNNGFGDIIGEVVQGPEDYLIVDADTSECTFGFAHGNDSEILSINPFTLNGLNIRIDPWLVSLCDPSSV